MTNDSRAPPIFAMEPVSQIAHILRNPNRFNSPSSVGRTPTSAVQSRDHSKCAHVPTNPRAQDLRAVRCGACKTSERAAGSMLFLGVDSDRGRRGPAEEFESHGCRGRVLNEGSPKNPRALDGTTKPSNSMWLLVERSVFFFWVPWNLLHFQVLNLLVGKWASSNHIQITRFTNQNRTVQEQLKGHPAPDFWANPQSSI